MLFRPLLGAPFPVPSLSCFIFYTRCLYCGGHGAPRFLSAPRSPRVGRTLWFRSCRSVASCSTGWASTPSSNLRPPFHISLPTTKSLRRHSHCAHSQPLQVNFAEHPRRKLFVCVLSVLPIGPWSIRPSLYPPFALSGRIARFLRSRALN